MPTAPHHARRGPPLPPPGPATHGFTVLAAAQLYKHKVNIELSFPHHPSVNELTKQIVATFGMEAAMQRPDGYPSEPFTIVKMQLYDEWKEDWVDLASAGQLSDWCQVYVFQKETPWHKETQQQIPPPQQPMKATLPDTAAKEDRALAVFEELDVNNDRVVTLDEMKRGFKMLRVDFTPATIHSIFSKGDASKSGALTPTDFLRLAEGHPTLIECLYYRSRDYWDEFRRKQDIKSQGDLVKQMASEERDAEALHHEAVEAVETQEGLVRALQKRIMDQEDHENDARYRVQDAARKVEVAQKERDDREAELVVQREREQQRSAAHADAQRQTDDCTQRLAVQEATLREHEDRERQLENALAEARRETERQRKFVVAAECDVDQAKEREGQARAILTEAQQETEAHTARLREADAQLHSYKLHLAEMERVLAEECRQAAHYADEEAAAQSNLRAVRERERERLEAHRECAAVLEGHRRTLQTLEADLKEHSEKRRRIEAEEQPLLDQEVDLRHQRDTLAEKEHRLRNLPSSAMAHAQEHSRPPPPRTHIPPPVPCAPQPEERQREKPPSYSPRSPRESLPSRSPVRSSRRGY